ncbi:type 4b pilus protein PilO2 [Burkholderia ambifaria]|uniref:type 4b pilus protein PilO2 n=1 Tax=Burkholderia ambifaria TaxID=152480 RepID=UPI001B93E7A4|nr:type 4b pilus protein PilO2 [Burkholderia ambifaria]MBR8185329.1 type 4b pilus protein PilO2 [Burkholderia ambifaria]
MATQIVQIGRQRFVCGLFWQSLSRRSELRKEGHELAKKLDFALMVLRIDRGVAAAGFANPHDGVQAGVASLGVIVSRTIALQGAFYDGRQQSAPNWLGAFRLPDDRWAYFAVRDGSFLPNGDWVGSRDEVFERLTSDYSLGGWNVVIGDDEIDAMGFHNVYPRRIEDLLGKRRGERVHVPGWARLRPVAPRVSPRTLGLAAAVLACAGAAAYGWLAHRQHVLEAERARAFAAERARLQRAGAQATDTAAQARPWAGVPAPSQFARACVDHFTELAPGGWDLERFVCQAGSVTYLWSRNGSTVALLLAGEPQARIDGTGEHASLVRNVPIAAAAGDDPLLTRTDIDARLIARFQQFEIPLSLAPLPDEPPGALSKFSRPDRPGRAWHASRLQANLGVMPPVVLAGYLDEPGVRLDKLTYQAGTWSAQGIVYAR